MSSLFSDFSRRDDKEIRKSLHDLSHVKRTSSVKPVPLRAQHSIPIQTPSKEATPGKTVLVKKFNKQMWRPPVGSPEGSDQRPFSPFGGTLPPSKINKKKVHEVFVWRGTSHYFFFSCDRFHARVSQGPRCSAVDSGEVNRSLVGHTFKRTPLCNTVKCGHLSVVVSLRLVQEVEWRKKNLLHLSGMFLYFEYVVVVFCRDLSKRDLRS